MKKFIITILLLSNHYPITPAPIGTPAPISDHNNVFVPVFGIMEALVNVKKNIKTISAPTIPNNKFLQYYCLEFLDGVNFGLRNYLIFSHLYKQGFANASTQIGLNLIIHEPLKIYFKENESQSFKTEAYRIACGSAIKLAIKCAFNNYAILSPTTLFETKKKSSFLKNFFITCVCNNHTTAFNIMGKNIIDNDEYINTKNKFYFNPYSVATRGFGIVFGILIAKYLLEEKFESAAKFGSEKITTYGPEILNKLISLTK